MSKSIQSSFTTQIEAFDYFDNDYKSIMEADDQALCIKCIVNQKEVNA